MPIKFRSPRLTLAALAASALLAAGSTRADIIFIEGNNPQPDEENILFEGAGTVDVGTTVTGVTNDTGLFVQFTSNEELQAYASGQARIGATDGAFDTISFGVVGGTFGDFILNLDVGADAINGRPTTGTATITAYDIFGTPWTYALPITESGQNFVTVLAINGQRISSINVVSDVGLSFVDLQQPRISGAVDCPPGTNDPRCVGGDQPVPEPGPLPLIGAALVALGLLGRRARR